MTMTRIRHAMLLLPLAGAAALAAKPDTSTRTGKEALGDWTTDAPGVRRKITLADLPKPYDTAVGQQRPEGRPAARGGLAHGPEGFKVTEFATKPGTIPARS